MSIAIAEINVCRQLIIIIILFEGPSLQPYCMLITITLNDAHSTCVAMYVSSVSTSTLNGGVFFYFTVKHHSKRYISCQVCTERNISQWTCAALGV